MQAVAAKYGLDSTMWSHTETDKEIKQWQLWVQIGIDQKCEKELVKDIAMSLKLWTFCRILANSEVGHQSIYLPYTYCLGGWIMEWLQTGTNRLEVEMQRALNISLEERLHKVCSKIEVKDELHFLAHCPKYKEQHDQ